MSKKFRKYERRKSSLDDKKRDEKDEEVEAEDSDGFSEDEDFGKRGKEDEDEADDEEVKEVSFVEWFCSLRGNEYFCEVDEDFIQDVEFNLQGLKKKVPFFELALDIILDVDNVKTEELDQKEHLSVQSAADTLYGLIHARYILTNKGISKMRLKYDNGQFGKCPRVLCGGQIALPMGLSDVQGKSSLKIFCPNCEHVYFPSQKYKGIDGAYFGTTFPHLFLMMNSSIRPKNNDISRYVPRVFGFKIRKIEDIPEIKWKNELLEKRRQRIEKLSSESEYDESEGSSEVIDGNIEVIEKGETEEEEEEDS